MFRRIVASVIFFLRIILSMLKSQNKTKQNKKAKDDNNNKCGWIPTSLARGGGWRVFEISMYCV